MSSGAQQAARYQIAEQMQLCAIFPWHSHSRQQHTTKMCVLYMTGLTIDHLTPSLAYCIMCVLAEHGLPAA